MKLFFSLILFIFILPRIECQVLFAPGVTHYFHWDNDPNRVLSYHVDTIIPFGDSVNYFFRPMTDHYLEPEDEICGLLVCTWILEESRLLVIHVFKPLMGLRNFIIT